MTKWGTILIYATDGSSRECHTASLGKRPSAAVKEPLTSYPAPEFCRTDFMMISLLSPTLGHEQSDTQVRGFRKTCYRSVFLNFTRTISHQCPKQSLTQKHCGTAHRHRFCAAPAPCRPQRCP